MTTSRYLMILMAGILAGAAHAADSYWLGINNEVGAAGDTDVNNAALWSEGTVPGSGDTAYFIWNQTNTNQWGNLTIEGDFAPNRLVISATADNHPHVRTEAQLLLNKDLTLETLTLNFGYQTSGGDGNVYVKPGYRLILTGSTPLDFGGDRGAWASLSLGSGASLVFPSSSYTFNEYNTTFAHNWFKAQGFRPMAYIDGFGYVDFTGTGATITLGDLSGYNQRYPVNNNVPAAIDVGYNALRVRSDQTWQNSAGGTGLTGFSWHAVS